MTAESSSARSNSAADSYIGSLISLTSKSDIRYEGVLCTIDTQESRIGLRNVRSFGTEGRKKDGPQVPPSDNVFDHILFRGSDIKDLQVKSSPPAQSASSINNDPAIILSHCPRLVPTSTALPSTASVPTADVGSHTAQMGTPAPNLQNGLLLYQQGGNIGPWGASPLAPSAANPGGLGTPLYWPGYYGAQSGMPQMHQQPLLQSLPGLSIPPLQQPIQHPNFNATLPAGALNLPETSTSLLTTRSTLLPVTYTTLSSTTLPHIALPTVPSETLTHSLPSNKAPISALGSTAATNTQTIGIAKENSTMLPLEPAPATATLVGTLNSVLTENPAPTLTPSLVTPGQLLQLGPTNISSSQSSQIAQKDVVVVQVSSPPPPAPATGDAQPPMFPLQPPARTDHKMQNGAHFQNRYGYRGRERGRGRGSWSSRPVTNYSEDFEFTAMNEKFNKDEARGHLGKNSRAHSRDEVDANVTDEEKFHEEVQGEASKIEIKPVYNKDDFFDSLSCDALDHNSRGGRTRFSDKLKVDTETFSYFSRYRGGRGPGYDGSFHGRGSYNRRGRGRAMW